MLTLQLQNGVSEIIGFYTCGKLSCDCISRGGAPVSEPYTALSHERLL
jgi:hypothetical protein